MWEVKYLSLSGDFGGRRLIGGGSLRGGSEAGLRIVIGMPLVTGMSHEDRVFLSAA